MQALQRAGLPTPIWSIADEPGNPDAQAGDIMAMSATLRAGAPGIKLGAQFNNPNDLKFIDAIDTVLINDGFGIDVDHVASLRRRGRDVWLYNTGKPRFTAGLWLWFTGASHYLQWHARMPTADPYDPTDGREGDVQIFWPMPEVCAAQPDIDVNLFEMAEGLVDQRWLAWLSSRKEPEARALEAKIKRTAVRLRFGGEGCAGEGAEHSQIDCGVGPRLETSLASDQEPTMKAGKIPNLQRNIRSMRLASSPALRILQMSTVAGLASLLCGCAGQPIVASDLAAAPIETAAIQAATDAGHQAEAPVRVEQAATGEKVVTVPLEKAPALSAKDEALVAKARALVCADCEKQPANAPDFTALALRAGTRMTTRQEAIGPVANVGARMSPEEVMGRLRALSAEARQDTAPLASAKGAMREMTRPSMRNSTTSSKRRRSRMTS